MVEIAGVNSTSFANDLGHSAGWETMVYRDGTVVLSLFAESEAEDKLVRKDIRVEFTLKQLGTLIHDLTAARHLGMEQLSNG